MADEAVSDDDGVTEGSVLLGAGRESGATMRSVHNTHGLLVRATRSEVRKIVAERMLKARELNGYAQTEAAGLFGYRNSSQLSQWETGKRMPPLKELIRASEVYRVSVDYLLGLSAEPDRDPASAVRRQIVAGAERMLTAMTHDVADALIELSKRGGPAIESALYMVDEGERLVKAFRRFVELNGKSFENMRGGSTLLTSADMFEHNGLAQARSHIERFMKADESAARTARPIVKRRDQVSANEDLFHGG